MAHYSNHRIYLTIPTFLISIKSIHQGYSPFCHQINSVGGKQEGNEPLCFTTQTFSTAFVAEKACSSFPQNSSFTLSLRTITALFCEGEKNCLFNFIFFRVLFFSERGEFHFRWGGIDHMFLLFLFHCLFGEGDVCLKMGVHIPSLSAHAALKKRGKSVICFG
ncbi:hypothetical protein CEXT_756611 [Caerostris extrusa]|uniref:Uncharacterized protein n=1 Tax=Caerostris extrusa TaxID=172846 RepID=A0AAV4UGD4_CAEEX|nr:hypothetical protein CEXT_756611 [Caerostris extrusa]